MRVHNLLTLPLALMAAPLAAQGFEGNLSMKLYGDQPLGIEWTIKGTMSLAKFSGDIPQMGPVEAKMIIDNTAQTSTMLMPVPDALAPMLQQFAPGSNIVGIKTVTDMKAQGNAAAGRRGGTAAPVAPPRKLGTSQTIAGVRCDDYELSDSAKTRACLTTALGKFTFPSLGGGGAGGARRGGGGGGGGMGGMGGMAGLLSSAPTWISSLSGIGFPLKVWTPDGKTMMEVTDIHAGSVMADAFAIPDGYTDLQSLMGGRGGRGGGAGGGGGGF